MTTLYDSGRKVKANRTSFGKGLLSTGPVYRDPVSLADRIEAAQFLNEDRDESEPSDSELEQAAGSALAQARMDAGFVGFF